LRCQSIAPTRKNTRAVGWALRTVQFLAVVARRSDDIGLYRHLHPGRVEHSWARRPDLGYRYDHAHGSRALTDRLISCGYLHQTRHRRRRLASDRPLWTHREPYGDPDRPLLTSDPATAAIQAEPEALF